MLLRELDPGPPIPGGSKVTRWERCANIMPSPGRSAGDGDAVKRRCARSGRRCCASEGLREAEVKCRQSRRRPVLLVPKPQASSRNAGQGPALAAANWLRRHRVRAPSGPPKPALVAGPRPGSPWRRAQQRQRRSVLMVDPQSPASLLTALRGLQQVVSASTRPASFSSFKPATPLSTPRRRATAPAEQTDHPAEPSAQGRHIAHIAPIRRHGSSGCSQAARKRQRASTPASSAQGRQAGAMQG